MQGVHLRRGELVLLAGGPGAAKSTIALNLAARISGCWTMYFSADSNPAEQSVRGLAIVSGLTTKEIEEDLSRAGEDYYLDMLAERLPHIAWSFDSTPRLEDIRKELLCYGMVHGAYPDLVVVDNLRDVQVDDPGNSSEFQVQNGILKKLKALAHKTGACVLVLHHVNGEYQNSSKPVPLNGIENKLGNFPQTVFTVSRTGTNMGLHPVKNRTGAADAQGGMRISLYADLERASIKDNFWEK